MSNPSARLLLTLAAVGWGSATTATKYALNGFGPLTLLLIELTTAAAVLWLMLTVRGIPRIKHKGPFAVLGLLEPTLTYAGLTLGLTYTTATNASLLEAIEACFTVALAAIFLNERIGARSLAGLLLTFMGVLLIEQIFTVSSGVNMGDLLVLGGYLAAAIYVILAVKIAATTKSLPMTAYQFGFGALLSSPLAVWQWLSGQEPFPTNVDPHMWLVAILIGGVGLAGSYLLYNYVINFVPAGLAGVTVNLIPIFGVLTAIIFLGEHPTLWHAVGGIIVISGIMLFPNKKKDNTHRTRDDRNNAQSAVSIVDSASKAEIDVDNGDMRCPILTGKLGTRRRARRDRSHSSGVGTTVRLLAKRAQEVPPRHGNL